MKQSEREKLQQLEREIRERQQQANAILREARIHEIGGEAELRKLQERQIAENQDRFANTMGFDESSKRGRSILQNGRSAFRLEYNSRNHGKRPDGFNLGALPRDAA